MVGLRGEKCSHGPGVKDHSKVNQTRHKTKALLTLPGRGEVVRQKPLVCAGKTKKRKKYFALGKKGKGEKKKARAVSKCALRRKSQPTHKERNKSANGGRNYRKLRSGNRRSGGDKSVSRLGEDQQLGGAGTTRRANSDGALEQGRQKNQNHNGGMGGGGERSPEISSWNCTPEGKAGNECQNRGRKFCERIE